jgi:pimeloyl-ACP methyl ester carboxylesterase
VIKNVRIDRVTTYVIIHGAWHAGELFEDTAAVIRAAGNDVHLPTLAGNAPGDSKRVTLVDAIDSAVDYIEASGLEDVVLVGHSYGGMIITGVADRVPKIIRRLVYWNAFVPNDGESLNDMVPPHYVAMFDSLVADDGSVTMPYPIWRDAFINDGTSEEAETAYAKLNPHPYATFTDPIALTKNPLDMAIAKSYINCTEDIALPQSLGWHPRLSEKLGLFRLVQSHGSHELCFTNPTLLAANIMAAGRD